MDEDYISIHERIREARRLRDEAAGELLAAFWLFLQRTASRAAHTIATQLRAHHLLPH